MKQQIGIAVISLTLLLGGEQSQSNKDRLAAQGIWKVLGAEKGGEAAPREEILNMELVFHEDTIQVRDAGKLQQKFKFKMDAVKDPRWLDLTYVGGPNNNRTDRAIYKLDGNDMKLCIQQFQDEPRPKAFATEKNSGNWLVVLRRFK